MLDVADTLNTFQALEKKKDAVETDANKCAAVEPKRSNLLCRSRIPKRKNMGTV